MATVPGRAVPLRGRSDQLSRGLSVLRRTVRHRRSGIVLVTGEPGIGKSALLDALTCEARRLGFVIGRSADRLGGPHSVPVRRMVDGVGGSPSLAVRVLEGLVRAAARGESAERVPDEFIAGVRQSLAGLGPAAADVVRRAAVLGRTFAVDEMTELLAPRHGQPAVTAGVEAALASGLLSAVEHLVGFRHGPVRETVYNALSDGIRRRFHRSCAQFLIDSGHSPLEAAPHARRSATSDDEAGIRILRAAADEAVPAMPETAAELITEAFRMVRPGGRMWLETGRHCVELLGRVQHAADAVRIAESLLRRTGDPGATARIRVLMSWAQWLTGERGDSAERIGEVLALLSALSLVMTCFSARVGGRTAPSARPPAVIRLAARSRVRCAPPRTASRDARSHRPAHTTNPTGCERPGHAKP
ncbi:ATP-binding protein [Streptomyces sasae]|uniref:ATP-binding protein n=1 Tax=Streptomyces sasae TaxID=1266772 RepID=UPI002930DD62|nr:ATP-binding protein [Streptomyces sasae]